MPASRVMLIRPKSFGANPETAATNAFQSSTDRPIPEIQAAAILEHEALAAKLTELGVEVCVIEDTEEPRKPDAVFPNNWISFHEDGTVVLYPMEAPTRRLEVRPEILDEMRDVHGCRIERVVDLTPFAAEGHFLEGTGSLVLDHGRGVAYAALSSRTHAELVDRWAAELGYTPVTFGTFDANARPIYHTNVLLALGSEFGVVCSDVLAESDRERVLESLSKERAIIEISFEQMKHFAANILELESANGDRILAMSSAAREAFTDEQTALLEQSCKLAAVPIPTIERHGGGSVRCMIAEIFA